MLAQVGGHFAHLCIIDFKSAVSFFHTTGTRLAKMCDTQIFSISEFQRGR
jgi:hypothetical protein